MSDEYKSVIVTVADDALNDIRRVAEQLSGKGMKVSRVMPVTGIIAGSMRLAELSALREVDGVTSVEPDVPAGIPESDADGSSRTRG